MEIKFRFCPTIWASVKELAGALQCASGRASVCIGARFRVHRGALRYASRRASVRVEARFRYASRRAAGTRRGALQVRVEPKRHTNQSSRHGRGAPPVRFSDLEGGRVSFDVVEQKMKWMQVSEKNPNPFQVPTLSLVDAPRSSLFSRGCSAGSALSFLSSFRFHSLSLSLPLFIFFPFMNYNINVTYF